MYRFIHIIPTKIGAQLTFNNVLLNAETAINKYLQSNGHQFTIKLNVVFWDNNCFFAPPQIKFLDKNDLFVWSDYEQEYIQITIDKPEYKFFNIECTHNFVHSAGDAPAFFLYEKILPLEQIEKIKKHRTCWTFEIDEKMSAIEGAVLLHFISTLIKLTDGLFYCDYSDDRALELVELYATKWGMTSNKRKNILQLFPLS